ncbi:MAG TPA: LCP family protein, partial [Chloroflexota bacterium]
TAFAKTAFSLTPILAHLRLPIGGSSGINIGSGILPGGFPNPVAIIARAPLAFVPDWQGSDRINILMLGTDQRPEERAAGVPTRTDVILVVSLDPVHKTAGIVSFPRDMWLPIAGLGEQRINEAYQYGERHKVSGGGSALVSSTLDRNFGLSTSHYAIFNFEAFQNIIDTLDGVVIDVPRPLKDDAFPTDQDSEDIFGMQRIYFQPGPQLMRGSAALHYVRSRHSETDFARNARQRQVLLGIRDRVLRVNALPNLPSVITQTLAALQTDLSPGDALSLAKLVTQIDSSNIRTLGVGPPLVSGYTGEDGASLLLPNNAAIKRAIQQLMEEPPATDAAKSTGAS